MNLIIVNESDEEIGVKDRPDLNPKTDIYRVSALWVLNGRGEVLLAQRAHNKKQQPGKWAASVAGTVEEGETYESNIYKEAREELGIVGLVFKEGPKIRVADDYNFFCQWYLVNIDQPAKEFVFQKSEVAQVKWAKIMDVTKRIREHPEEFTPSMGLHIKVIEDV